MAYKNQNKYERIWKEEGKNAFLRGQDVTLCPYDKYSESYDVWVDGWLDQSEIFESQIEHD